MVAIKGAWQKCSFAGLDVIAYPTSKRGLYFTDETIEVTFEFTNTINKRLRGQATFFYGFGPSGLEGKSLEQVSFDLQPSGTPGDKAKVTTLARLVGIQGNGVIGWLLQPVENHAIDSETDEQRTLNPADIKSKSFQTLYTFVSYNREFYQRVYVRQEQLIKRTNLLTKIVIFFAAITFIVLVIQILNSLGILR